MKTLKCFTLSGKDVSPVIKMEKGKISCWGGPGQPDIPFVYALNPEVNEYSIANIGKKTNQFFLQIGEGEVDQHQTLVFVHEYFNGSGAKRWPGFHIDWNNAGQVEILIQTQRHYGSGSDTWSLIIAPHGWVENIAAQFIDERDYPSQIISYKL
ncbi:MAG: hypothetical protein WC863_00440 [Patescibacteria group bacterium]